MYRYKSVWCSDVPTKYSEKDKPSMEEHSCSDAIEEDLTSSSMNQLDAISELFIYYVTKRYYFIITLYIRSFYEMKLVFFNSFIIEISYILRLI